MAEIQQPKTPQSVPQNVPQKDTQSSKSSKSMATVKTPSPVKKHFKTKSDLGNHWFKLIVDGYEEPLRIPSYLAPCSDMSGDILGHVKYLSGDCQGLIGQCWLVGTQAYRASMSDTQITSTRLVEEYNGKSDLWLQYFLGAIAHLPTINSEQIHTVSVSCNDVKRHKDVIKAYEGTHTVELRGQKATIQIKIASIVPEGYGAIKVHGLSGDVTLCDIGGGNVTVSQFSNANLIATPSVADFGVDYLLKGLMADSELKRLINQPPSEYVLTKSLETGYKSVKPKGATESQTVLYYGTTGIDIYPVYIRLLNDFIKCKFAPIGKRLAEAQNLNEKVLVIGGGSKLPGLRGILVKKGFIVSDKGVFANVEGLD
ncbi:ParM/StbA family protein [Anabaena sp. CCY 9402-a]|uniref:ParM/StbA family protein n=1 Tax=Anabaena sp. CCY 9402-a TaxID=3103867 RepID=UPI0039C68E74